MLTRRRRITPTVSFTRKLHLSHLNQTLESSEVLFQGLLRTKTTDAAWRPLSCILYLLYFTISFPPHIWQNWSALSSSTLKCFLPTQKKKFFLLLLVLNRRIPKHSRPHVGLSRTRAVAMVTAVNSPVQPAVLSMELTVTSEHHVIKIIIYLNRVWCRAGAAASTGCSTCFPIVNRLRQTVPERKATPCCVFPICC